MAGPTRSVRQVPGRYDCVHNGSQGRKNRSGNRRTKTNRQSRWSQVDAWLKNVKQAESHWQEAQTLNAAMRIDMPISESEIEKLIRGHESRNQALRQTLLSKGVDPREPRMIECHFGAWGREDAASLSEALAARGFQITVQRPARSPKDPSVWNVEAAIRKSIDLTMRRELTEDLVRIAASCSAEYDGWGTTI
jgi:regulator of RNase E activity RraB